MKQNVTTKIQRLVQRLISCFLQAKTLEQALTERNATIRQLQWELLQRDMSAMQLQEELRKVKEKKEDLIGGQDQKRKNSHNRSWSSMEATSAAGNKQHVSA